MYFNTLPFIFFFGAAFSLYYLLPSRHRNNVLLIFSLIFFLSNALLFLFVVCFLVLLDYYTIKYFENKQRYKKTVLLASISVNLIFLIFFKYIEYLFSVLASAGINIAFRIPQTFFEVLIPLGFSFFVFKSISLLLESYRNNLKEKTSLRNLLLYFLFFPSVLSGPIDRPETLLKQFRIQNDDFFSNVKIGLSFIFLGYIKKSVVADRLSLLVDVTYGNPEAASWLQVLLAVMFYTFQIYFDFSGYSDMALGFAKMFGIDIMQNFEKPYFAKSIQDFWRRWHVSLSTWLRDYLFLPLAYSSSRFLYRFRLTPKAIEKYSYVYSILITMFLAGLWHGANTTFVLWGLIMGVYIVISFLTKKQRSRFKKTTGINKHGAFLSVFQSVFLFIIVSLAWIFFRADSVNDALVIIGKIFSPGFFSPGSFTLDTGKVSMEFSVYYSFALIILIMAAEKYSIREKILALIDDKGIITKYAVVIIIVLFIIFAGNFSANQFIYFKF